MDITLSLSHTHTHTHTHTQVPQLFEVLRKYCDAYDKFTENRDKAAAELQAAQDANDKVSISVSLSAHVVSFAP